MTDHIKAARQAAEKHADEATQSPGEFHPSWADEYDRKLYAIAYRQGMERAAEICEAEQDRSEEARADARFKAALKDGDERNAVDRGTHWMAVHTTNAVLRNAAKAIRAHAQNQPKTTHDGSVV